MAAPKPQPVVISENLLWSTILFAVMIFGIDYEHLQAVFDTANAKRHIHLNITYMIIFMVLFQVGLILLIFSGRRWGRTVLLVSYVMGFPAAYKAIEEEWHRSAILSGLTVIQTLVQLVALFLLFSPEAAEWFDTCRRQRA